jgi:peptidase E
LYSFRDIEIAPFEIGYLLLRHQQAHFGLIIHDQVARHIEDDLFDLAGKPEGSQVLVSDGLPEIVAAARALDVK